ncbi:oxidoreductase, short-chain dehydrogenase/reductase family protein [Calothrix parasitica NIES-267]|uniref:Oxidoreductase, short-chain dehydrogenase/reductase family protein n=1 Tax=Calothrix parasitica NIES-267 TaxID=1973488 RepID=A0A1Z4LKK7_9CYAN|nr:oxidoreductase, short-chain dehydrogenase/reductase family protein [Calothrix parasitica NIES-267]
MKNEQTKIALVTGGNRGIGFAITQGLLQKGYRVIITSRSLDKAKQAAEKLNSSGIIPVELDVSDDDSINQAFKSIESQINKLDVLINNAGIYPDEGVNILTIDRNLLNKTLNTNTFGAIRMVQELLPLLKKSSDARIVNVSSGFGEINGLSSDYPSYSLSKLALNGATIMLSQALRSQNIAVNAICPGWVKTDMGGDSAPRTPEQGADTAIWLATEASRNETGKYWRDRKVIPY